MMSSKNITSKPIIDVSYIKKISASDAHYASLVLSRLGKRRMLKKITRNKYTAGDSIPVLAAQLYVPCYLSFWSASQYLGYTEQILNTLQIVTTSRRKTISFEGYKIKFIVLPKKYFFGFNKIETKDGALFVAEPEKLLIDALLRPQEMGNFDEIIKIVQNALLDVEKLTEYLLAAKNISLIKRAGYLMEKYKNVDLSSRLNIKDTNYVSLNPFIRKAKQVIPKWRIKV